MGALSPFLRNVAGGGLSYWCQGCRCAHTVWTGEGSGPRWTWNGDVNKPVFTPSVLVTWRDFTEKGWADYEAWQDAGSPQPTPEFEGADKRCHTFIGCNGAQPGEVIFLSDCTHALAGQVLPLEPLPTFRSTEA